MKFTLVLPMRNQFLCEGEVAAAQRIGFMNCCGVQIALVFHLYYYEILLNFWFVRLLNSI